MCGGKEEVGQDLRVRNVVSLALWVEAVFDSKHVGEERDELSLSLSNQSSNGTKHGVVLLFNFESQCVEKRRCVLQAIIRGVEYG